MILFRFSSLKNIFVLRHILWSRKTRLFQWMRRYLATRTRNLCQLLSDVRRTKAGIYFWAWLHFNAADLYPIFSPWRVDHSSCICLRGSLRLLPDAPSVFALWWQVCGTMTPFLSGDSNLKVSVCVFIRFISKPVTPEGKQKGLAADTH